MLHHLLVNISLCISKKRLQLFKTQFWQLYLTWEDQIPRSRWNWRSCAYSTFYSLLNKGHAFQVSLDPCMIPPWWLSLCDGESIFQSFPICVWMVAPFSSSPFLLRLPKTVHGDFAQAQQWSFLLLSKALLQSHDRQTDSCPEETATDRESSYLLPSSMLRPRGASVRWWHHGFVTSSRAVVLNIPSAGTLKYRSPCWCGPQQQNYLVATS